MKLTKGEIVWMSLALSVDSWPSTEETLCLSWHYIRFWNHGTGIGNDGESPRSDGVQGESIATILTGTGKSPFRNDGPVFAYRSHSPSLCSFFLLQTCHATDCQVQRSRKDKSKMFMFGASRWKMNLDLTEQQKKSSEWSSRREGALSQGRSESGWEMLKKIKNWNWPEERLRVQYGEKLQLWSPSSSKLQPKLTMQVIHSWLHSSNDRVAHSLCDRCCARCWACNSGLDSTFENDGQGVKSSPSYDLVI